MQLGKKTWIDTTGDSLHLSYKPFWERLKWETDKSQQWLSFGRKRKCDRKLNCSRFPLWVNYHGQSVVDRRFQTWLWPMLLPAPAGRYLLNVPRGNRRQYSASLIASSPINKYKINGRAKCKAQGADLVVMKVAVVGGRGFFLVRFFILHSLGGSASRCTSLQTSPPIRHQILCYGVG